jgi:F-type H+-transporting ATPase subunit c
MRRVLGIVLWSLALVVVPSLAMAAEPGGDSTLGIGAGMAIGAGLAVGLAGLGCGIGQGLTAGNTTAGIARNPGAAGSMFTNFILAMVLIESIAIYGLVVALLLYGSLPG